MVKNNTLQIVFCGNDKMFTGLYLCMLSILRRTKANIDFYILTGNLTNINRRYKTLSLKHGNILLNLAKSFNSKNTLKVMDCSTMYYKKLSDANVDLRRWTPYTLFRLFIEDLGLKGLILYLDVDMLISGDIKEAFNVKMDNVELCVCQDLDKEDWNNGKYFNAGSLLINMDYCSKTHLLSKAFKYCVDNNPDQLDQSALNACWTKIVFWKNQYRFNCQPGKVVKKPVINHFYGAFPTPKPWNIFRFQKKLRKENRHTWDEDYKIYKQAKRSFNKYK